ncbi:long-chain fatty acid--CoA ligase [Sphingobium sp.]|uniref:long-chain fatty acid--CoA ligase n=1 Tax=Sphingobium sp. TaxID=1912891 RepID=UPI0028BF21A8|nr:long-chain fatty acid--CoA ligase [Sphingobium sp.]
MQSWPLTVDRFIDHAARWHADVPIASRNHEGAITHMSWEGVRRDASRLSHALAAHGIMPGDRIGTLAMNGVRHVAAWFGIMGMGAICHTLNPRFSDEQLSYIINHAADRLIFIDRQFLPLVDRLRSQCPVIERVVVLDGDGGGGWERFLNGHGEDYPWGRFDENSGSGLCYTSGTTGAPKGVLYTHRSNYLHTMMILQPDSFNLGAGDIVMPVVPMFHANGWGLIFAAAAVGAKLVLPGSRLDGASLHDLIEREGVTVTAGVPTVWLSLLAYLKDTGKRPGKLKRVFVGGAACSEAIIRAFDQYCVEVQHVWGMTELSPVGTSGRPTPEVQALSHDEQIPYRLAQGRSMIGVDLRIVDEQGKELPRDGKSVGAIQIRGHSVVGRYYRSDAPALDADGFFDTGDVGTIDAHGYMRITDRAKDVIKSGGEWISSVDIEINAMNHPGVELAAAIGVLHPKWNERPLLLLKRSVNSDVTEEEIRELLSNRLARWAVPDAILFVDDIPLGATGKIDKKPLRARYRDYYGKQGE